MMTKGIFRSFILVAVALSCVDCASFGQKLKAWLNGSPEPSAHANVPQATAFSNTPSVLAGKERRYKRVTKDNFSDEQMLEENAGSLWRKEGQGSYLFSQNNLRLNGDIINVTVEGKAAENLSAKLSVIKQAIARLEAPPPKRTNARAPSSVPKPEDKTQTAANGPDAKNAQNNLNGPEDKRDEEKEKVKDELVSRFDAVPCRIIEKNTDGSYRVKGQSSVYVGRREYKLIVTGIVRAEDISQDEIASSKIIDSKFDLVATNKELSIFR